ncbi:MAG: hypothetical protein WBV21_11850 [Desulfobacterales bacterium]
MEKTIAEKIFAAHLVDNPAADIHVLRLDRVFCHEITTPIAINDLVRRGRKRTGALYHLRFRPRPGNGRRLARICR